MVNGTNGVGSAPRGGAGTPPIARRPRRQIALAVIALTAGAALLAGSALALATSGTGGRGSNVSAIGIAGATSAPAADPLTRMIAGYQSRLRTQPRDWQTWGNLGLAYVQEARVSVNPGYYPKAAGALNRSLSLRTRGNFIALAGRGALEAARHDFRSALRDARAAARINPYNVVIFGALADAQTQLGRYAAARRSINRMMQLHPGTPAFARLSYADELAGAVPAAAADLKRALDAASAPADRAFVYYYLGELSYNHGHPHVALSYYMQGLRTQPDDSASLEGKAKAEAALGRNDAAVRDYTTVVNRVPQPTYVLEFGDLLRSLGRESAAARQFSTFVTELRLFRANGVQTDLEPAQYYADHGAPDTAVRYARAGLRTRPFVEVQDALAWALHKSGRDRQALRVERQVMRLGMRNAVFAFHAGMIQQSLGMRAAARADLTRALRICPYFNPVQAPIARQALARLGGAA